MNKSPSFNPKQIQAVTFHPHSIQALQMNKQLNSYINETLHINKTYKKQCQQIPGCGNEIWHFYIGDKLSLKHIQTLFSSFKQVNFAEIRMVISEQYKVSKKSKIREEFYDNQVNLMKCLSYPRFINLTLLQLNHCNIKSIQGLSCINMPRINTLYISNNPITNYQAFSKCNFRNLTHLGLMHNYALQTGYLNHLSRFNLHKQMTSIDLDDDYIQPSAVYNPVQIPKQWIDMRPLVKLKCKETICFIYQKNTYKKYIKARYNQKQGKSILLWNNKFVIKDKQCFSERFRVKDNFQQLGLRRIVPSSSQ